MREVIVSYFALMRSYLEYCIEDWRLQHKFAHGAFSNDPLEGNMDDQEAPAASFLRRQAQRVGLVQSNEEKALGRPHCGLSIVEWNLKIGERVTLHDLIEL